MESPTTHTALRRCVPLITLIALAVMGVVAASRFALRDALCIVASFVVALVVPEWLYNSGGRTSPVGHLVLAVAWCIVAASALHHFVEWTYNEEEAATLVFTMTGGFMPFFAA